MNVVSLFDGMSCGQIALNRLGIKYDNYFASETDKRAIQVTQHNFSGTIQLGNVLGVKGSDLPKIDLLTGGSPCQGFSNAGKGLNFDDPSSRLFFEFVRLKNELAPAWFLLENVSMKLEWQKIISNYLGVEPIRINSNLVSAQNRPRLYWTNIPVMGTPIDKQLFLSDIIDLGVIDRDPSYLINERYWKGSNVERSINNGKSVLAFTEARTEEAKKIRREFKLLHSRDFSPRRSKILMPRTDRKMNCLTATFSIKEHSIIDEQLYYRKITPLECERLQTVPDNYTSAVSNSQRYKMLGNGWTVDIIAHIFSFIPELNLCPEYDPFPNQLKITSNSFF